MTNQIFVGNLSNSTTANDLVDAFSVHGHVLEAKLMLEAETGRPRGFAFVTMASANEARNAISALHNSVLHGKELTVSEAKQKPEVAPADQGRRQYGKARRRLKP